MKKKSIFSISLAFFFVFTLISTASNKPAKTSAKGMPDNVKAVIDKSCFGCHNSASKNEDAKDALDFKKFEKLSKIQKIGAYKEIGEVVEEGKMPPKRFLQKYPDKKLTEKEVKLLIDWSKKEAEALVKGN